MCLKDTKVLFADDDDNFRKVVCHNLEQWGMEVHVAPDGQSALDQYLEGEFDILLTDVKMPKMNGEALLREVRSRDSQIPVILITAHGDIEMAVNAMQAGATDFLTKPFQRLHLREKLERALRSRHLERENLALREELTDRFSFESIIGSSAAMRNLHEMMGRVAHRDATVLILGESGTGKELVARGLHYAGSRKNKRFVAINCAAIPANLLESELFGHVKGAFTGAIAAREGRFRQASGGSIFLDEIGDMPLELQAKLLRVLQERKVEPVGSSDSIAVDVRIIAATNKQIDKLVQEGRFREDLYYRLHVVPLQVPPLRDRREDIPLLVKHFLRRFGEPNISVDKDGLEALCQYHWPGNVRELENTVERALALRAQQERLTAEDLQPVNLSGKATTRSIYNLPEEGVVLDELEKTLIVKALDRMGGNQTHAAELLGISRQQLIYRTQKFEIQR